MATNPDQSKDKSLQILAEWKKLYAEALIDTLKPSGNVLQIGYGLGIAADRIQKLKPKSHVIIESNPTIVSQMKSWAEKNPGVSILEKNWEQAFPKLGAFDAIFFNDDSQDDGEILNGLFPEQMELASNQAKQVLNKIKDQIAHVKIVFTEMDSEEFYQKIGQFNANYLFEFFSLLKENGNVSEELYKKTIKKYHVTKGREADQKQTAQNEGAKDSLLMFLEECVKNHMRKGSRFTGFLKNQESKYPDSAFFESIITNPELDYREETITINMSDKPRKAIIMLVEKIS